MVGKRMYLFQLLYRISFAQINLIDVGSAGKLPSPWAEHMHKIRHLLAFEPREGQKRSPLVLKIGAALWSEEGERDLYIYKGGTGSSLFRQNVPYVTENYDFLRQRGKKRLAETWLERSQLESVEKIYCRRLDDVLAELNQPFRYQFLKIDAQGAEYEILKGAQQYLREDCLGLQLELFTLPLYQDIRLLPEVVAYLEGLGFDMVKKYPAHGSFASQHECIFLRRGRDGRVMDQIRQVYKIDLKDG